MGFSACGISGGIKAGNKKDMALLEAEKGTVAVGVFTDNKLPAAFIKVDKEHLKHGSFRGVLVTSGVANAGTGKKGIKDTVEEARLVSEHLGCGSSEILVLATGRIGLFLPMDKIKKGIPLAVKKLSRSGGKDFSRGIMTTDTFPKMTAYSVKTGNKSFRIAGTVKGAGMIMPSMATMLAFVTTDAAVPPALMKKALKEAVDASFNRISVDGCMSTNDTVLLMSSGKADFPPVTGGKNYRAFCDALKKVCCELSDMIVEDGEGMSKIIDITVKKAASFADAKNIAASIANNALFKCAIFGQTANWGRVFAAVGAANARVSESRLSIAMCGQRVLENGEPAGYSKKRMMNDIKKKTIPVVVDMGLGKGEYRIKTVDLTKEYVEINKG